MLFSLACHGQDGTPAHGGGSVAESQLLSAMGDTGVDAPQGGVLSHASPNAEVGAALAPTVNTAFTKLLASEPAESAAFGSGVATTGEVALVGMPLDKVRAASAGAAYTFSRTANAWSALARIEAPDPRAYAFFGQAVSMVGDTLLIGAPGDAASVYSGGAAYLFSRTASGWTSQVKMVPDEALDSFASFGFAVSLDGERALIGASSQGVNGVAYIFGRSGSTWTQQARLVASDTAAKISFGYAVSLEGERALVGALGAGDRGAAYVFERNASVWSQQARLVPDVIAPSDTYGMAVSLEAGRAIVGEPSAIVGGIDAGACHVFERSAASWTRQARLFAASPIDGESFGRAISADGERVLIGAARAGLGVGIPPVRDQSAAYLFARNAGNWIEQGRLLPEPNAAYEHVGASVSLRGQTALVGVPGYSEAGVKGGVALVFGTAVFGTPCAAASECASGQCSAGVCCNQACDGACERCDLAGQQGQCVFSGDGVPGSPSCAPYLCADGSEQCPSRCSADADCEQGFRCEGESCLAKESLGAACTGGRDCSSGHCADGLCCDRACDGGCDRCNGKSTRGTCAILMPGEKGDPGCGAYLCDGARASCPEMCAGHDECSQGHHCLEGRCQGDLANGDACSEAAMCETRLCTDGLCCLALSCAPYRCGAAGACLTSCGSNAECGAGSPPAIRMINACPRRPTLKTVAAASPRRLGGEHRWVGSFSRRSFLGAGGGAVGCSIGVRRRIGPLADRGAGRHGGGAEDRAGRAAGCVGVVAARRCAA